MYMDEIGCILTPRIRDIVMLINEYERKQIKEIILFRNKPIIVSTGKHNFLLNNKGLMRNKIDDDIYIVSNSEFESIFVNICEGSVYAHHEDIVRCYITIKGGHRVGVAGSAVYDEMGLKNVNNVSCLNIRIARQIVGCADDLINTLLGTQKNIIVYGPPSSGKTTVIRDIARILSERLIKTAIIDERSEIAATYIGESTHNLGCTTIVLDGFLKSDGIERAIRGLSPNTIICDEIGNEDDIKAIKRAVNSGCRIIATSHAGSKDELLNKNFIKEGLFYVAVHLDKDDPSRIKDIFELNYI